MNCPKCGNEVSAKRKRCEVCGKDLTIYRRTYKVSNAYYNRGLEKARVRDLSGAVTMLKKSLEMNKNNTDARNLLGLVFYEMGETVAALSEWVISKHFQANNNDADYYIDLIQQNPTKLDGMNLAIRKYNLALESAKQGNDDLAMLQLRKVVALNPQFIRAQQLLALMYMKNNEFERAKKCLIRVKRIDVANTTTLSYLREIKQLTSLEASTLSPHGTDSDATAVDPMLKPLKPISSYKEDKPNIWLFVNLILGVLLGVGVTAFLIVPTVRQNAVKSYVANERDYNAKISSLTAKLTSEQKQVEQLNKKLEEVKKEAEKEAVKKEEEQAKDNHKEALLNATNQFNEYDKSENKDEETTLSLAALFAKISADKLNTQQEKDQLKTMMDKIYPEAAKIAYQRGKSAFEQKKYEEARDYFLSSYTYEPKSDSTIYNLAKSYQRLDQYDEARSYYQEILDDYPNSDLVKYTKIRLNEMEGR